jgi:hypothetical protein
MSFYEAMPESSGLQLRQVQLEILNFFRDQGKIAMVSYADPETKASFERRFEELALEQLNCEIMHLKIEEQTDELQILNNLLSQIPVSNATRQHDAPLVNYLLMLSNLAGLNQERLNALKTIVLQLPGLSLKLFVSVPSPDWRPREVDTLTQKTAYWHIPRVEISSVEQIVPDPSRLAAEASLASSPAQSMARHPKPMNRLLLLGLALAMGGAIALNYKSFTGAGSAKGDPDRQQTSKSEAEKEKPADDRVAATPPLETAVDPKDVRTTDFIASAPVAANTPVLPASQPTAATPATVTALTKPQVSQPNVATPATVTALTKPQVSQPNAATPATVTALPKPQASQPTAATPATVTALTKPQVNQKEPQQPREIMTVDDCINEGEYPVLKPVSVVKNVNYIYLRSAQNMNLCVAHSGGKFKMIRLKAYQGYTAYGNQPWRLYSPDLTKVEVFAQGAKVKLDQNVIDRIEVIYR